MVEQIAVAVKAQTFSLEKSCKFFQIPLDKLHKVCYNKYVRGTGTLYKIKKWVATIAKCQRHRKDFIMTTINTAEMTMRKFFEAVIAIDGAPADVIAKAESEIAKMDAANAKRQSKPSKTAVANEPIKADIVNLLTEQGAMVASDIAKALTTDEVTISTSKVSALCRQLVADEVLTVTDVKVKGKGTVKQYSIA